MLKRLLLAAALGFLPITLSACGGASLPNAVGSASAAGSRASIGTQDVGAQDMSAVERQILDETNAARAQGRSCGGVYYPAAAALSWNGYLAQSARAHAQDMADHNYFSHTGQNGSTMQQRNEAAGYTPWSNLGENIEAGVGISAAVPGWLKSPSHCQTLMDPKLKELGVGYVFKAGTTYGTYWVQEFGSR